MRAKLAFAAVLLVLVAAGFYWYSERGTKLSVTDSILIGDFTNATGDPVLRARCGRRWPWTWPNRHC